ncbi:prepilin-type N-terminal cleavage/methylation domain-containing protein [Candidatus Kaiserbacteria bacterium]|nr:prepilin-type N-terminal cleavage/methylation domain-containing protein [Candidatus Kaiserbacteria bacterium]
MIQKIQQGFTLIETLIAVLILTTAITGPLTIASKGLTATLIAKDQISAFYLAQDAVEYVRFLRDSACLAAGAPVGGCAAEVWLSSLTACTSAGGGTACYFDSLAQNPATPATCAGDCPVMRYDTASHAFNYNGSATPTPQKFTRTVTINNDPSGPAPDEAILTVTVTWANLAGITHTAVVRENILRWQ